MQVTDAIEEADAPAAGAAQAAIQAGLRYLASTQSDDGEWPFFGVFSRDMAGERRPHPCFFGTVLIANMLAPMPDAAAICSRACDFIEAHRKHGGVWGYFKNGQTHMFPPPDVDDTALATAALIACGRRAPDNRALVLGSRDSKGMFFTWMLPRIGCSNLLFLKKGWRHLFYLRRYYAFYRNPIRLSEPDDVDAGVNANVLASLGQFDGDELVIAELLRILRAGEEESCDKYYDEPPLIRYLFSRALVGRSSEAGDLLVERAHVAPGASALDVALTILVRAIWGAPVPSALVEQLIDAQLPSGAWPIACVYTVGRKRLGYLQFAPADGNRLHLGSEAMTTAFCVAALHAAASTA